MTKIDPKLKLSYSDRRRKKKERVFEKSKWNTNILFKNIKNFSQEKVKIGPFLNNDKLIRVKERDSLNSQYAYVFSTGRRERYIGDLRKLFMKECYLNTQEKVHFCSEDYPKFDEH